MPEIDAAAGFWPPADGTTRLLTERLVQWTGEAPGNGPSDMLPLREVHGFIWRRFRPWPA